MRVVAGRRLGHHVGAPHRCPLRHRGPRRALAQVHHVALLDGHAPHRPRQQVACVLVHLEDHRPLRAGDLDRAVRDRVQHLLEVERGGKRLADRGQGLHLGGTLRGFLVLAGAVHRQGHLGGHRGGEILVRGRPRPRAARVVEGQGADDAVAGDQRHHEEGADAEGLHPRGGDEVRRVHVLHHHRPARLHRAQIRGNRVDPVLAHLLVALPQRGIDVAVGKLGHHRHEHGASPEIDGAALRRQRPGDLEGHRAQQRAQLEGGRAHLRDLEERGGLARPVALTLHAARGADGQRRLLGEARDDGLVAGGEEGGAPVVRPEERDDVAVTVEDGRAHHRLRRLRAGPLFEVRGAEKPRVGQVRVGAHRPALGEDEAAHSLAGGEAGAGELGGVGAQGDHHLHVAAGRVHEGAEGTVRVEEMPRLPEHGAQRGFKIRRGQGLRGHPLEGLDLVEPLQRVRVEPGVPHRGGGGGGDGGGQLDLVGGEFSPSPRHARDDPDGAGVEEDGDQHRGANAFGLEPRAVPHPRVLHDIGHHERLLGREDPSGEALAHAERLRERDRPARRPRLGPEAELARASVEEPDADDVDSQPRLGHVGEALEDLAQIEGGRHQPAGFGEDLELTSPGIVRGAGLAGHGNLATIGCSSLGERAASWNRAVSYPHSIITPPCVRPSS